MGQAHSTVTVEHEAGLHARPAALFVQTAARFPCSVRVGRDGREANAKSIVGVLSLGVTSGKEIEISAEGDGAEEAVAALVALVRGGFAE